MLQVSSAEFLEEVTKAVKEVIDIETELEAKLTPKINRMVKTAIANELDGLMETGSERKVRKWDVTETRVLKKQFDLFMEASSMRLHRTKASVAGKIWREKFLQLNL